MSEPKFTPGPWTRDFGQPDWIKTPTGSIAIVGIDSKISDQEDSANAALIAVAPEMYESLQLCVTNLRMLCACPSCSEFCDKIEDLLKKARGEE